MKPSKALTFCILAFTQLHATTTNAVDSDTTVSTSRAAVRHKDPNSVGYNQGYSTFEVFGAPRYLSNINLLPFIDARVHIFNDGQPAVNSGIGAHYLSNKIIWGINSYYDYRKTNHWHYNQYSLGLEMLSRRFDIRLNGYLPVGSKESKYYDRKFSHFADNYAYICRKKEFAMQEVNA